jgi:hypothetical protein
MRALRSQLFVAGIPFTITGLGVGVNDFLRASTFGYVAGSFLIAGICLMLAGLARSRI